MTASVWSVNLEALASDGGCRSNRLGRPVTLALVVAPWAGVRGDDGVTAGGAVSGPRGGELPPSPPTPAPPVPDGPPAPPVPPAGGGVLPAGTLGTRLTLSKRADAEAVRPGETITYRLRVANVGEAGAVGVLVCDPLPRGLTVVRARGFHRQAEGLCQRVGRLVIGAARVLHITTRATRSAPRSLTNTATARAVNARRVRARATVGAFAPCAAAASRPGARPVARAAC